MRAGRSVLTQVKTTAVDFSAGNGTRRKRGRQMKRWEYNVKEWTDLTMEETNPGNRQRGLESVGQHITNGGPRERWSQCQPNPHIGYLFNFIFKNRNPSGLQYYVQH